MQAPIVGPRRLILKWGPVRDRKPSEPKWGLVLECGHMVFRYVLRMQNRGMARCDQCARELPAEAEAGKETKTT